MFLNGVIILETHTNFFHQNRYVLVLKQLRGITPLNL